MLNKNIALSVEDVSIKYSSRVGLFKQFDFTAVENVSFNVEKGETYGVMGRNGCGKSTLLRVLAGVYKPTSGRVLTNQIKTRTLLTLGLGFDNTLSGADNAVLSMMLQGFSRRKALAYLSQVKEFSELGEFFDKPVRTYSSGMRARLGFSTGITTHTDLLLIDESLAVGDKNFNKKAELAMMDRINSDQTVVFVSHSAEQVRRVCSRAIWLEKGIVKSEGCVLEVADDYAVFQESVKN